MMHYSKYIFRRFPW